MWKRGKGVIRGNQGWTGPPSLKTLFSMHKPYRKNNLSRKLFGRPRRSPHLIRIRISRRIIVGRVKDRARSRKTSGGGSGSLRTEAWSFLQRQVDTTCISAMPVPGLLMRSRYCIWKASREPFRFQPLCRSGDLFRKTRRPRAGFFSRHRTITSQKRAWLTANSRTPTSAWIPTTASAQLGICTSSLCQNTRVSSCCPYYGINKHSR